VLLWDISALCVARFDSDVHEYASSVQVMWRNDKPAFKRRVREVVRLSQEAC
jgi:hypothetical protein